MLPLCPRTMIRYLPSVIWTTAAATYGFQRNCPMSKCKIALVFFSFQQQVEIFLDGETVYRFVPTSYARSKTPGNKWNFLPLDETANGKTLTIHIYQCYGPGRVTVPDFYYGSQSGIMLNYLAKELPRTYFSLAMVFVGCLLCIFHTLKRNSTLVGDSLKWLALFAIFRGTWSYIECNTYSLYAPQRLFLVKFTEAL